MVRSKLLQAAAVVAVFSVAAGCGRDLTPAALASPPSISLTELNAAHSGFIGGAYLPGILAAPSLTDLLGLIHGLGFRPNLDECSRLPEDRSPCWLDVKDPGDSLMVATYVHVPCSVTNSVSAALSGANALDITVVDSGGGGGACEGAYLSLLAIPMSALPSAEMTVSLLHVGAAGPTAKMMVDVRRPLNISTDLLARTNEVRAAYNAASNDAMKRLLPGQVVSFLAMGTNRWADTGLGCPGGGQTYSPTDATGYVFFLQGSDNPQLAMEYHISGVNLAYCGQVPLTAVVG